MRYFFLILVYLLLFVVAVFGFRGDKFKNTPIRIFPDMDEMDRINEQSESSFFADGVGSRVPVAGTLPQGVAVEDTIENELAGFENKQNYLHTGKLEGGTYGTGLPKELALEQEANAQALLTRGAEVFGYKCAICHGKSGNGQGVVAELSDFAPADLRGLMLPDGQIYHTIANGKGKMGPIRDLVLYDRWAVVAYLKALKAAGTTELPNN